MEKIELAVILTKFNKPVAASILANPTYISCSVSRSIASANAFQILFVAEKTSCQ